MAYILGKKEFYGREFILTPDVLVPRPESETIIELLIKHQTATKSSPVQIIDVGTGSGCLAITAKLEIPELEVLACDISQLAIDTAKANATKLGADVKFFVSNLLSNADSTFDYILANLPYVPTSLKVTKDVLAEPKIAVFAGSDGLDTIRRLLIQCPTKLRPNGVAIFESLKIQHAAISKLAQANSLELVDTQGLVQVFKRI